MCSSMCYGLVGKVEGVHFQGFGRLDYLLHAFETIVAGAIERLCQVHCFYAAYMDPVLHNPFPTEQEK